MPCTITDLLGYRSAAGTLAALTSQTIIAVPAAATQRVSYSGTYRPLVGVNPNINDSATQYGVYTQTDGSGSYTFVLPYGASETKPTTNNSWTLIYPDGSMLTGVVPSVAGPLTVDDLISTYSWSWSSERYVAPVTPGTLAKGTATFTAASSAAIVFGAAFASAAYQIYLTPSVDSVTGSIPAVGWSSKSTSGFTINTSGSATCSVDWQAVL